MAESSRSSAPWQFTRLRTETNVWEAAIAISSTEFPRQQRVHVLRSEKASYDWRARELINRASVGFRRMGGRLLCFLSTSAGIQSMLRHCDPRAESRLELMPELIVQSVKLANEHSGRIVELSLEPDQSLAKRPIDVDSTAMPIGALHAIEPLEPCSDLEGLIIGRETALLPFVYSRVALSPQARLLVEHRAEMIDHGR